ncbi:MAG: iron ABC transporter permease [Spirochaetaceae bacterium]|nr:iron ABC transporter permease [Spirochaetaceae bacterium]MCF7947320.1 iron ABC transporter permease [Spirochaetia bacterium]MCF7950546.1 iron ABC transporter permease [Spirochaetaceae bacterium]
MSDLAIQSGSPLLRRLKRNYSQPQRIIGLILLLLLLFFVFMPMVNLLYTSFTLSYSDQRLPEVKASGVEFEEGKFSLVHFRRVFMSKLSKPMLLIPLMNTLLITAGLTILSISWGCLLAWLVVRTNLPGKKALANIAALPYIIPSWVISLAWINVFKNQRIGGSIGWFEYMTGIAIPNWFAYGPVPIIICLSLHYYAYAFITVSGALASIDSRLEETGELLGANRWQVMRKITLPLVMPSILAAFILTFSKGIGTFGTPAFLGIPVRYYTLSTQLYANVKNGLEGDAYLLAIVMILISGITIYMNVKVIGARKSYVTIAGKGFRAKPIDLGKLKHVVFIIMVLFVIFFVLFPIYILLAQTFMEAEGDYSMANFTTHFWIGEAGSIGSKGQVMGMGESGILRNPSIYQGAWNSLRLAVLVSFLAAVIGIFLGYAIVRGKGTILSKMNDALSFAPYIIPGIAFGAVYLGMFAQPRGPIPALYGTFSLLVIVSLAKRLPFSSRTGTSAMMQIDRELEEAAGLVGAGFFKKFTRIIYPLTKSGFVAGFLLSFITTMRELSLIVLLVTPKTKVLTTMIFRYAESGFHQFGDAITMIIVVISITGTLLIKRFQSTSLVKGV